MFGLRRWLLIVLIVAATLLAACGDDPPPPEVPLGPDGAADPVLLQGRAIWGINCVSCHSTDGSGGRGKRLNEGRILQLYETAEGQKKVIVNGKGNGMPSFQDRLTDEEIDAVVRYTREVL